MITRTVRIKAPKKDWVAIISQIPPENRANTTAVTGWTVDNGNNVAIAISLITCFTPFAMKGLTVYQSDHSR
jgi:hypothetical protein